MSLSRLFVVPEVTPSQGHEVASYKLPQGVSKPKKIGGAPAAGWRAPASATGASTTRLRASAAPPCALTALMH